MRHRRSSDVRDRDQITGEVRMRRTENRLCNGKVGGSMYYRVLELGQQHEMRFPTTNRAARPRSLLSSHMNCLSFRTTFYSTGAGVMI